MTGSLAPASFNPAAALQLDRHSSKRQRECGDFPMAKWLTEDDGR
jgi:hypothetical protein